MHSASREPSTDYPEEACADQDKELDPDLERVDSYIVAQRGAFGRALEAFEIKMNKRCSALSLKSTEISPALVTPGEAEEETVQFSHLRSAEVPMPLKVRRRMALSVSLELDRALGQRIELEPGRVDCALVKVQEPF